MRMQVFVKRGTVRQNIPSNKEGFFFDGTTVNELLSHLNITPDTVIVERNGEVIPEQSLLSEGDELLLLDIITGG